MTARRALLAAMFATCAGLATAAIPAHAQPAPPYAAIPPLREEVVPPMPPGRRVVWEPGHWQWTGRRYDWIGGHYIAYRPRYAHFVHGHWAPRGAGWVWVGGHWE